MRGPARRLAAAAMVVLGTAACGVAPPRPTAVERGRAVFVRSCADCHTLLGREVGADGGDLARTGLGPRAFARWTRIMPARFRLSDRDVAAVTAYVVSVARHVSSSAHPARLEWRSWG